MKVFIMKKNINEKIDSYKLLEYICIKKLKINFDKEKIYYKKRNKPYYKDFYFNISNSKNFIALVIGKSEVGIDIEENRKILPGVKERIYSKEDDENINIFELWTLKEAYSKFLGIGLLLDFKNISIAKIKEKVNVYNLSNNNYYLHVLGKEQLEIIEEIDYGKIKNI